jgi:hypothetical protein
MNPYEDTKNAIIKSAKNAPSLALHKGQELLAKLNLAICNTWTTAQHKARDIHDGMAPAVTNTLLATKRKATETTLQLGNDIRHPELILQEMQQEVSAITVLTRDYVAGHAKYYLPTPDQDFWASFYKSVLIVLPFCLLTDAVCVIACFLGHDVHRVHELMVGMVIYISIATLLCIHYQSGNSDPAIEEADELIGMALLEKIEEKQAVDAETAVGQGPGR